MLPNKNENYLDSLIVKLSYNNQIYEIPADIETKANELRRYIFSKFNLNNSFILTYRGKRISKNDFTPLHILFDNDWSPFLFINDNNTILPSIKSSNIVTLNSNLSQQKLLNIINLFFITKNIPFNASIKNSSKGVYNIKFNNSQLSSDFLKYYRTKIKKNNYTIERNVSLITEKNINNKPLKINKIMKLPLVNAKKIINKTASTNDIISKNDKSISLINVINENTKSDLLSQRIIESGFNIHRQSNLKKRDNLRNKKNIAIKKLFINEKYLDNDYESTYLEPFMNEDEKYYREKFLDKKNWINKSGFIVSVGKYKMKGDNFIPNYVNATPSEPPINYKYREVNKEKWINKNGFLL